MNLDSYRTLNNGVQMPCLGFGVWRIDQSQTEAAVRLAIETGYRHIDTAAMYGNEAGVGEAVRACGLPRSSLFVTTKLWNTEARAGKQQEAFEKSIDALGLDYVDLYLLHWPVPGFVESWMILEEILASGRAKAIGVSNFQIHHLEALLPHAKVVPAVNQVESHPYLAQTELLAYCASKDIACQAWRPLGGRNTPVLDDPVILDLAKKLGKTPAQIVLRWNLQRGMTPLVKSANKERMAENTRLFDFALDDEAMSRLNALDCGKRFGEDPDNFDF